MARTLHFSVVALLALATGCVSQEQYNALKLQRDRLQEQLTSLDRDAQSARAEADALRSQLGNVAAGGAQNAAMLNNLNSQLSAVSAERDDLLRRYEELLRTRSGATALPKPLNDALVAFAQANPDVVSFDPQLGAVKFKSDVTFASGDATLTPKAREVISRFADILNSSAANKYELLVAGHTDDTPVTRPETIAKGHKNNWYLSSHRAISVAEDLMKQRVNSQRVGVVGYADQRPAKSNATSEGKAQNRRVEVVILPNQMAGAAPVTNRTGSTPTRTTPARTPDLNKDTATINPGLNK